MRRLWAVGLAALLAACATPRTTVPHLPVSTIELNIPWTLQGRIAIRAAENSQSGQLHWQHTAEQDVLTVSTPLGQGVARIVQNASGVTLEVPNQPPRRAPNAESLTREALGVGLPLSGLRYWILVRPDPSRPSELTRDANERITQIRQDGWTIDYVQSMSATDMAPRKLTLARPDLEIRLVIDSWML